jgi:ABC-type microcin C transport system duplicated ATPase subunit YejF
VVTTDHLFTGLIRLISSVLFEIKQLETTFSANGVANQVLKGIDIIANTGEFIAIQGPSI